MKRIETDWNNIARNGQLFTYLSYNPEVEVGDRVVAFTGDPEPDNEEVECVVVSIEDRRVYLDPDWHVCESIYCHECEAKDYGA